MSALIEVTPQVLADMLNMPLADLGKLSRAAHKLYTITKVPKKTGESRIIEAPFKRLKNCQRIVNAKLLGLVKIHHSLHGRPATSQLTAAGKHTRQPMVVTMDVQDFFPSISSSMVTRSLLEHGFPSDTAQLITRLCTRRKRLPQGAPTSPSLARIVVSPVLEELSHLLSTVSRHCEFTQFVDDLTISGPAGIQRLIPTITSMWKRHGFVVHPRKTKVMPKTSAQEVLGTLVNDGVKPTPESLKRLAEARATLAPNDPHLRGLETWHNDIERQNQSL